ncbi:GNAT family N-acetyltransferase [Pararhodonellum marinum]|uniref:GNAT family N-acetyltransferase n=1 Tax=Pararhodonellum marinum TaxID=2755358 RepID=UPI00188F2F3B|nr:GNAT family N-acetyltransferase [Pararhodonellum marinum]
MKDATILIKRLKPTDIGYFVELIHLFESVFELPQAPLPSERHLNSLLRSDKFIVYVAIHQKAVVGGLTAYVLDQYHSERPLAYLYDLAVAKHLQRHGIGKRLIEGLNAYCQENDFEEVFVQADREEAHAVQFYRNTPHQGEEDVQHFYYRLDTWQKSESS